MTLFPRATAQRSTPKDSDRQNLSGAPAAAVASSRCVRDHDEWGLNSKGHRVCKACARELIRERRRLAKALKPLAATAPRRLKRRRSAYLDRAQIKAAYALYQAGMSLGELAERGWRQWGYANKKGAELRLREAFLLDGMQIRSKAEANTLRWRGECVGCGCDRDERTAGCEPCTTRHCRRRRAGRLFVSSANAKAASPAEAREAA